MYNQLYNPYQVVEEFEKMIAQFAGAKYGVAVESCSAALFLCCLYKKVGEVTIPSRTYTSVPCSIINAGGTVNFVDKEWQGVYELEPYNIWDGALRFKEGMYKGGLHCLSFHIKKTIPIGRGGMILTDDEEFVKWAVKARFDGRDPIPLQYEKPNMIGWDFYMTPEQAVRGIQLFRAFLLTNKSQNDMDSTKQGYPDLSKCDIYKQKNAI